MRNNTELKNKLDEILSKNFQDKEIKNPIIIKYGRKASTRLGSIRKIGNVSHITLSGYFLDMQVPEQIIDLTIAHELCHYFQGFCSDHDKIADFPHQGKLVDRELIKRGYGDDLIFQKKWLKEHWPEIAKTQTRRRKRRKYVTISSVFNSLFGR